MKSFAYILKVLISLSAVFFITGNCNSQTSYKELNVESPKHYFNTLLTIDSYRKPERELKDTLDKISKHLKSYGIRQFNLSFCTPLATFNNNGDTSVIKNGHLLLTVNYMSLRPTFSGISDHRLVKFGVGIRYIYNTGKKGVWFVEAAPFVTRDATFKSSRYYRLASTLVYSHNISSRFNFRVGVTKSFLWGNRFYWPFVGLRFGRLDRMNISIQFPRSINFNVPVNSKLIFSFYTKPQGGMFNFSNRDSLYYIKSDATFNFTRYELNSGLRLDVRVAKHFNFYVASGISSKNNITFYSERSNANRPRLPYKRYFYSQNPQPTFYFNLGLVFIFGKTRSYYNDKNMYDAVNLGNMQNNNGNAQIPLPVKQKKSDANLESIKDLVDYNDF